MKVFLWNRRKERGWSTRELAERSGISKSTINRIENGQISPTVDTVEILAKTLDCTFWEMFKK